MTKKVPRKKIGVTPSVCRPGWHQPWWRHRQL